MRSWLAPKGLHIEMARTADADTIAKLHAAGFYRGWSREEFAAYIAGEGTPIYVACDAKRKIAGFAMLRHSADEVELITIAVDPKWRRKGVGEALLRAVFDDLLMSEKTLRRLGPAINSGRGLFLFGAPGNGKSSIAERITRAFGSSIWIPKAIGIDGEVIRLFDPSNHEVVPMEKSDGLLDKQQIDRRWLRIRRPTIIVGGELTMSALEVTLNTSTGVSEAPIQLKSNCGTLVIDDFGRQRMPIDELLNRWIVPLEQRHDYLNLPNGKKIQVPFDQLIVFSTNLEPRDLVDDAFLRRIPYKIEVVDPTEDDFRRLFETMALKLGVEYRADALDYLLEKHYRSCNRPLRCCQPRDLLMQVRNLCVFMGQPPVMSREYLDIAVETYFAIM